MEKSQIWAIVGIALVVAVFVSIATASITGNIIKQNENPFGRYKLYTTLEIDQKFNELRNYLTTKVIKGDGNLTLTTGNEGNIILSPETQKTTIFGTLVSTYITSQIIKSNGELRLISDDGGIKLTPGSGYTFIEGSLAITNLRGNGTAYACIDDDGKIFRSLTRCR